MASSINGCCHGYAPSQLGGWLVVRHGPPKMFGLVRACKGLALLQKKKVRGLRHSSVTGATSSVAYGAGGALRCHKGLKSGSLWYVSRWTSFPEVLGRRDVVRWVPHAIVLLGRRHLWCQSLGTGTWWNALGSPHLLLLGVPFTFPRGGSHVSHSGL